MGFLDQVTTGVIPKPHKAFIHGMEGVGKSSLAMSLKDHIVLDLEDSTRGLPVTRGPKPKTFLDLMSSIEELATHSHPYKFLFIDTIDWAEKLMWQHIADQNHVKTIDDIRGGYGGWKREGLNMWREMLQRLDYLVDQKNMMVILLGHSVVEKVAPPGQDNYDKYTPALESSKGGKHCEYIKEWADEVFFMHRPITVAKKDTGNFGKTINVPIESTEVVFETVGNATFDAKNRLGLTSPIPVPLPPHGMDGYMAEIKKHFSKSSNNKKNDDKTNKQEEAA